MIPVIIMLVVLALLGLMAFLYINYRNATREAKALERGLKMIPLRIDLPPVSDDVQGEKDNRDITDESVSKALSLYNILSGVYKSDGMKDGMHGQRHVALEIVMNKGRIYFYAVAPAVLRATVEQAILSAYPTATIVESAEHNIFSERGKLEGTYGGELVLKEDYSRPIATYNDSRKDSMVAILNSFSSMSGEDGAALQLLIRPADPSWSKHVKDQVKAVKDGDSGGGIKGALKSGLGGASEALWKVPEGDESGGGDDGVDGSDSDLIESMEQKIKYAGFETLIRVVASSSDHNKAQQASNRLVSVFSIFDAQGRNGFKFVPAKDMDKFIDAYILRMFPVVVNDNILNSVELATIFHLPDQKNIPTSKLKKSSSKTTDAPTDVASEGVLLGYNIFRSTKTPIYLSNNDRRRHLYIVGQTGVGKSVFMENIATQDIMSGRGFAYIDPHGDGAQYLMSVVPPERIEDVIYFCPADMDYPMGLNLFESNNEDEQDFLIQESINMLYKLYDPNKQGIVGPRLETIFRNSAKVLMADPKGGTFIEVPKLLSDQEFLNSKLKYVKDRTVLDYWLKEVPNSKRSNDYGEVVSWVSSKFGAFLSNNMMRNIIGQTKSSFDLRDIMDNQKILIVNLSKGRTGDLNSKLLGMIFVMRFQAAAMSRADMAEEDRKDFSLYVDEFQNFSTDSFATILSEARKFRLSLVVANQFTSQLDEEVRDAVFGNVGSMVSFRVGPDDAESLSKQFQPIFNADDLVNIPNFNTATKLMINNVPSQPFSMKTIPPLAESSPEVLSSLIHYSAVKYGRPRDQVEKGIFSRIYGDEVAPQIPSAPSAGGAPQQNPNKSPIGDWLSKRKSQSLSPGSVASPGAAVNGGALGGPHSPSVVAGASQMGKSVDSPQKLFPGPVQQAERSTEHSTQPSGHGSKKPSSGQEPGDDDSINGQNDDAKKETKQPSNSKPKSNQDGSIDLSKDQGFVVSRPRSIDNAGNKEKSQLDSGVYVDKDGNIHN